MTHFVVIGDDIAATAAALALAEMSQSVTLIPGVNSIPIADMWRIGPTPPNAAPMQAVDWYQRQYEWLNASNVRWVYTTSDLPMWCNHVDQDSDKGELLLYDEFLTPWSHSTAVIFTQIGSSPDPRAELHHDRFFNKGLSFSAWSDREYSRSRPIVVLGCGASAVEQTCLLAEVASRVTVLCEEGAFSIPDDLSEVARLPNVKLYQGVRIGALVPSADGSIAGVEFWREEAVEKVDAAAVFVAYDPLLSWEIWGGRDRALALVKQQRLYLAGVPAGVPYRDHYTLFEDGQRAAREAVKRWGGA